MGAAHRAMAQLIITQRERGVSPGLADLAPRDPDAVIESDARRRERHGDGASDGPTAVAEPSREGGRRAQMKPPRSSESKSCASPSPPLGCRRPGAWLSVVSSLTPRIFRWLQKNRT